MVFLNKPQLSLKSKTTFAMGRDSTPKAISASVIALKATTSSCRAIQASTEGSGASFMHSEITLVSRMQRRAFTTQAVAERHRDDA